VFLYFKLPNSKISCYLSRRPNRSSKCKSVFWNSLWSTRNPDLKRRITRLFPIESSTISSIRSEHLHNFNVFHRGWNISSRFAFLTLYINIHPLLFKHLITGQWKFCLHTLMKTMDISRFSTLLKIWNGILNGLFLELTSLSIVRTIVVKCTRAILHCCIPWNTHPNELVDEQYVHNQYRLFFSFKNAI
jgi:hypothetical protein